MLKTISLYSIFLLAHFSSSFAQSPKEHLILGTYHVYANQKSSLLGKIRSGSYLYVRANSPNSAMRYGIGIGERVQNVRNYRYTKQDTIYTISQYASGAVPRLILGKEWHKTLHPDVQIIGGGDISLGGGAAADNEIVIAGHEKGEEIRWNEVNNGAILSASIAPFTGIRISWGRLVLGYSASLPIDLDLLKQRNISLIGLETNFSHDISFGYRFGKGNKSK